MVGLIYGDGGRGYDFVLAGPAVDPKHSEHTDQDEDADYPVGCLGRRFACAFDGLEWLLGLTWEQFGSFGFGAFGRLGSVWVGPFG